MTTTNNEPLGGVFKRLMQAAKVYAFNYVQDEADDEDVCIHPQQHAEAKELFAAIKEAEELASQQAGAAGADPIGQPITHLSPAIGQVGLVDTGAAGAGESIDTPEFQHLMSELIDAVQDMETSLPFDTARAALIAHITAWKDAQLARERQGGDEPVRYENRMRGPSGHYGDWIACNKEFFDRFSAAPDIGDGFSYETRALYTHPAAQAQGEPVAYRYKPYGLGFAQQMDKWNYCDKPEMVDSYSASLGVKAEPLFDGSAPQADEVRTGKSLNAQVADLLRPFLKEGQKVIWREPFRWHDDNGVLSNHYDGFSIEGLAEDFEYEVPYDFNFGHAAIVGPRTTAADNQTKGE